MLTISKPLSASQAQKYHAAEFTSAEQNYWKQDDRTLGEWHGKLAGKFGLAGAVDEEHFARLANGQHPVSSEQLVIHRQVQEYTGTDGQSVAPVEHRAGWDATFSAPKSVSLTALVGGDHRVREAHGEAVDVALNELERYTQARIGGNTTQAGASLPPKPSAPRKKSCTKCSRAKVAPSRSCPYKLPSPIPKSSSI